MKGKLQGAAVVSMKMRHLLIFLFVLAACVSCDHAAKQAAQAVLHGAGEVRVASGIARFELVSNPGAFLSLGARLPDFVRELVFVGAVPLMLLLVSVHFLRIPQFSRDQAVALGLVAGGGLGNWIDRLLNGGSVTDFVSLNLGILRTGIFNVADVAVMAGALWLIYTSLRRDASELASNP